MSLSTIPCPFSMESLESRRLLSSTIVEFDTVMGSFQVELFDEATPQTVANFLNYVNRGDYDSSLIHRSVPGFVIQGGGFTSEFAPIPTDPPVPNEPGISNTRGTIAMAKLPGDPDSATSQWFINLDDNSEILDEQNGGFTVFGQVLGDGMDVVDAIAALPTFNFDPDSPFTDVPLRDFDPADPVEEENLVLVNSVSVTTDEPVEEGELVVTIGAGLPRVVTFTDAAGTTGTVELRGRLGTADVRFTGGNLQETVERGRIVVTGENVQLEEINATGTNFRSNLLLSASGGDGQIDVGRITTDGSLGALGGRNVNVTDDVTVAGGLRWLTFGNVANSNILISNGGRNGLTVQFDTVQDTTLNSAGFIRDLRASEWGSTTPAASMIESPRIRQLTVPGDFDVRLDLSGEGQRRALGTTRIGGEVGPSPWALGANAHQLFLNTTSPAWQVQIDGQVERARIADPEAEARFDDQVNPPL